MLSTARIQCNLLWVCLRIMYTPWILKVYHHIPYQNCHFWDLVDPIFRREESESYRIPAKIPPVAVSLEARIETPS